jgi:hypothetical protein
MNWNIASSIAAIVSAVVSMIFCYQIIQTKKQFIESHRVQRNIYSCDLMRWWVENTTADMEAARQFVERLSTDQCELIVKGGNIKLILIDTENAKAEYMIDKLRISLGNDFINIEIKDDILEIKAQETARIKALCIKYLNTTETVLSAWRHNTANRRIMAEEFEYIIHVGEKFKLIEIFRNKTGGEACFPAISEFIESMLKKGLQPGEQIAAI